MDTILMLNSFMASRVLTAPARELMMEAKLVRNVQKLEIIRERCRPPVFVWCSTSLSFLNPLHLSLPRLPVAAHIHFPIDELNDGGQSLGFILHTQLLLSLLTNEEGKLSQNGHRYLHLDNLFHFECGHLASQFKD